MDAPFVILIGPIAGVAGIGLGYLIRFLVGNYKVDAMEMRAKLVLETGKREADSIRKESEIAARAEILKAREEFEKSVKSRRKKVTALEERISEREINLERKVSMIDKKERIAEEKLTKLDHQASELEKEKAEVERAVAEERAKLEHVAGMTQEEAKKTLLSRLEEEVHTEAGGIIRRLQEEARKTAERKAQEIVVSAIQRYSSSHATEMMTSSVALPGDEMKGRIIGRDGRNIRALEAATGVNILIDDTPEAVVISGFDPIRRETARLALENLIADGRIHPARIEEVVAKVHDNIEEMIRSAGEEATYVAGIQRSDPELLRTLGRLKFRTSYTQNVLQHSVEVSHLMGVMAGEVQLDVTLAKRIGLFHDIGKALDHEVEGGHAVIGADLLKRQGESQVIVNAVAAHHEEVEAHSLYAVLCAAADAISSSRLGARSETTDIYVKRLEKLENIANSFNGVNKSYAIHAGREVRVVVVPDEVDDNTARMLARNVSKKIESDLQYPGNIRVTVIRETRCVEYAR